MYHQPRIPGQLIQTIGAPGLGLRNKLKLRQYLIQLGFKAPVFGDTWYLADPWYGIAVAFCAQWPDSCEGIKIKPWRGKES